MSWIAVSPCPNPAAARASLRRPPWPPAASSLEPSPDPNLEAFLAAVADQSRHRRTTTAASSLPTPGSLPPRPLPSLYNALMKSFSRRGRADEVLRLFRDLKRFDATPNALCYNTLINSLVAANRPSEAEAAFEEMVSNGVSPTTSSFTILIKLCFCHPGLVDSAYEIIWAMARRGCRPDAITYSTVIAGLCRAGRIVEAWGVLDQMIEDKCLPTLQAFTCILHGYCSEGRIEEARRLIGTMESVGCPPDVVVYSILIEALCKIGEFDEVEKVLKESESKGWKPNAVTYNIYMNGLCKAGKVDEAFRQLEVMRQCELHPTVETLNILFDCLCRDSKVLEAKRLLERSTELDWDVDVFFYNTLMSRLCDIGEWSGVLKLLSDMVKKGIGPDTCSFTIVIRSLCKAGKLRKAKCVIGSQGFQPDVVAFNTLLHGFYLAREFDEVRRIYLIMALENVAPNKFTYSIMIDSLCGEGSFSEAVDCFLGSLKDGFLSGLVVRLNNRLVKGGKLREILNLLNKMQGRGLIIDALIVNSLVRAFCREGYCQSMQFYKVCLILDRMLGMR